MEARRLEISKRATRKLLAQAMWYHENRDDSFTNSMMNHIFNDINALCKTPTIGRTISSIGRHKYHTFISNHKCIIKYWYTQKALYVVDLIFTDTNK